MLTTKLEAAGIALACEVEACVRLGTPVTTALINALDQFRKTQIEQDRIIGADLDAMYKQVQATEAQNIIDFRRQPKLSVIKLNNEE